MRENVGGDGRCGRLVMRLAGNFPPKLFLVSDDQEKEREREETRSSSSKTQTNWAHLPLAVDVGRQPDSGSEYSALQAAFYQIDQNAQPSMELVIHFDFHSFSAPPFPFFRCPIRKTAEAENWKQKGREGSKVGSWCTVRAEYSLIS